MKPLAISLSALLFAASCGVAPLARPRESAAIVGGTADRPRFDQPDAAETYAREKRLAGSGLADPRAAWERAVARRDAMRPYALAAEGRDAAKSPLAARWESLGPGNIGGRTRVLLVDPSNPATLYAAGVSGGVFKSTDEGASWRPVGDELANIAVNALAIDPANPAVLYAGTGEGYFREEVRGTWLPLRGGGVFATADGGATWTRLESTEGADFHWVNDIAIGGGDPARLYAATRTGVWRSSDRGSSWERVLATEVKGGCLDLALRPGAGSDVLFASCGTFEQATVYRNLAAEGNDTWDPVLSMPEMGRTTLAIAPSDPDVVYAVAASNVPIGGSPPQGLFAVFRSGAGGEAGTWEARTRGDDAEMLHRILLSHPIAILPDCRGSGRGPRTWITMGWYCNVVMVDPLDPERLFVGGVDLFRSDDGARTWAMASRSIVDGSYLHVDQHGIAFDPRFDGTSNRTMYVVNDGGVYRTRDARGTLVAGTVAACDSEVPSLAWESLNHGFGVTQFYHGAVSPDGTTWIGGTQDNGTIVGSDAAGPEGWEEVFGGDGGYVAIDPREPRRMWVESQWGSIARLEPGEGGIVPARPTTDPEESFLFVTPFALDGRNPRRLWVGGSRLWRSETRGDTWSRASPPLGGDLVSAIGCSPHDSDLVLAGTTGGRILRTDAASRAGEATVWSGSAPRPGFVSSIAFDPFNARTVFATYAGFSGAHVWRSADGGVSWESIDGRDGDELPDIPVHAIVVDPRDSRRLYIGSDLGVFVSLDGGASWMAEREGMPAAVTEALVLARRAGRLELVAFTHGRGVWRVALGSTPRRRPVSR